MGLHPQAQAFLDQLRALGAPPLNRLSVDEARRALSRLFTPPGPVGARVETEDLTVPGPAGPLRVRLYRPAGPAPPLPLVVYFHGGGFVLGSLDDYDPLCGPLTERSGCLVASVDYRLAPEHPFPSAVEDCDTALRWLVEHAPDLGADPERVAVAGDSAGGNLATVVALLARDRGAPRLACQVLIYPVVQMVEETESLRAFGEGLLLTREMMEWFRAHYLRREEDARDWRASPLRAPSLAGLPPTFLLTAEYDPLRDEGEAYARRLQEEGVPVVLKRYGGMIHGFVSLPWVFDAGREALEDIARALRRALGGKGGKG